MKNKRLIAVIKCVAAAVAYIALLRLVGSVAVRLTDGSDDPYLSLCVTQLAASAVLAAALHINGRSNILRGGGFVKGIAVGGFLAVYILLLFPLFTAVGAALGSVRGVGQIICFAVTMAAVGFSEEVMFRGVIQNVICDAFGRDSAARVRAGVAVSGAIFGFMHFVNVFSGIRPAGVAVQMLGAAAAGMYFGAIYLRSGSLWSVITLHAANDLTALLTNGVFGLSSAEETISNYGAQNLLSAALYFALAMFLLRPKKAAEFTKGGGSLP